jgi:hypothetical protein
MTNNIEKSILEKKIEKKLNSNYYPTFNEVIDYRFSKKNFSVSSISENFNKENNIKVTHNYNCLPKFNRTNSQILENTNKVIGNSSINMIKEKFTDNEKVKNYLNIVINNKPVLISICKYIEYEDLLNLKNSSKKLDTVISKSFTIKYIISGGISNNTRQRFWINNINFDKLLNNVKSELQIIDKTIFDQDMIVNINVEKQMIISNSSSTQNFNLLDKILKICNPVKYETSGQDKNGRPIKTMFAKSVDEISKDLNRTFEGKYNSTELIKSLENILVAISFIRPEIGYCQGMNFVSGALLELLNNEVIAFWTFLFLLDEYELNSLYYENMPDYSIRIFQLEYYIKIHYKVLFNHFKKNQISAELIFSKWILTLFSSYLGFDSLKKIYDIFLIEGWKAIITFCLIFLGELEHTFLQMDLQMISKFMRENNRKLHTNINKVLDQYNNFKITNQELLDLREEYFRDQVIKKIKHSDIQWDNDQLEALEIYRTSYDEIQKNSKGKISHYKEQFEYYNMLFKATKENFKNTRKKQLELKFKLEELIDSKIAFEKVILYMKNDKSNKKEKGVIEKKCKNCEKKINELNKEMLNFVSFS